MAPSAAMDAGHQEAACKEALKFLASVAQYHGALELSMLTRAGSDGGSKALASLDRALTLNAEFATARAPGPWCSGRLATYPGR